MDWDLKGLGFDGIVTEGDWGLPARAGFERIGIFCGDVAGWDLPGFDGIWICWDWDFPRCAGGRLSCALGSCWDLGQLGAVWDAKPVPLLPLSSEQGLVPAPGAGKVQDMGTIPAARDIPCSALFSSPFVPNLLPAAPGLHWHPKVWLLFLLTPL